MSVEWWSLFGGGSTTWAPLTEWKSWTCNCACSICMAGACCMDPNRPSVPTYTSNGTAPLLPVHEHDYRKFDPARLFCRTCGEMKDVR